MTALPLFSPEPSNERVPRTYDGIVRALRGEQKMRFFREFGEAPLDQIEAVLRRWWCEAMLDTDPDGARIQESARAGTLPTTTLEDVITRRKALGLPVE